MSALLVSNVPEGMVFQYRAVQRHTGGTEHIWALHNDDGAIHISAWRCRSDFSGREWMGGIECHWASAPEYMSADKPSHDRCWILGKPCWHDGSSLYFSENIAFRLPYVGEDMAGVHQEMLVILRGWHRDKIASQPIPHGSLTPSHVPSEPNAATSTIPPVERQDSDPSIVAGPVAGDSE